MKTKKNERETDPLSFLLEITVCRDKLLDHSPSSTAFPLHPAACGLVLHLVGPAATPQDPGLPQPALVAVALLRVRCHSVKNVPANPKLM